MTGLGHVSLAADGWDLNTVPEALLQTAAVAAAATTATKISPELFPRIQKRTVYPSKTPVMRKTLPSIQKTLLNDFYARNTAINAENLNDFCLEYSRLYRKHTWMIFAWNTPFYAENTSEWFCMEYSHKIQKTYLNDFCMKYSHLYRKHSWMIFLHGILPWIQKQILQSMQKKKHSWTIFAWNTLVYAENTPGWFWHEYSRLYRKHIWITFAWNTPIMYKTPVNDFCMEYSHLYRKHTWMIFAWNSPFYAKNTPERIFAWNALSLEGKKSWDQGL